MKNNKLVRILMGTIWTAQLLIELLTFGIIWQLDMFPTKYMIVIAVLFALLWLLTGGLLMGKKKENTARRVTGLILVTLIVLGCAGLSGVISQLNQTMHQVTGKTEITTMMTVYVRADDSAQQIQDASDYTFAVLESVGADKTRQALSALETTIGAGISTLEYELATELMDALEAGEADAILVNRAYLGVLEETTGYTDYEQRLRVLYEVPIVNQTLDNSGSAGQNQGQQSGRPLVGDNNSDQSGSSNEPVGSITQTPFLVYLSGNDTRSTTLVTGRSDVNILAVVNPVTKQILLLNTPRDYFVVHPNSPNGERDKLTHLGNDGIDCSIRGLEMLYGERVDFYAQINFTGFETLIDAIGGITVSFDRSFLAFERTQIYAGENHLNGEQALHVARDRMSFADGDNARGRNQMKIIKAVVQKMVSGAIISNYADIMASIEGMFVTDITMNDISKLVKMQLDDMAAWNIQTYAVTGAGGEDKTYTAGYAWVMYPDQGMVDFGSELIERVIAGEILTEEDVVYHG